MQHNGAALLVIDMQQDFFERQPTLAAQRESLVTRINDLTARFRRHGRPVIWIRQEFLPDLSDAFSNMRRDGIRITIAGTPGSQFLPELLRAPGEIDVTLRYLGAHMARLCTNDQIETLTTAATA